MQSFDLRETIIPFSLLQLTNYFKSMNPGDRVEIYCSDENVTEDLKCLLPEQSYEFIRFEKIINEDNYDFRIELKKIKALSPQPAGGSKCPTSI